MNLDRFQPPTRGDEITDCNGPCNRRLHYSELDDNGYCDECAPESDQTARSITLAEMSGNETDEQYKEIAWRMLCQAYPVEAHAQDPDRFWNYFHERTPQMSHLEMVALLEKCKKESAETEHDRTN